MDIFRTLSKNAAAKKRTIILPESSEPRVIEAVKILLKKKICNIILIGDKSKTIPLPDNDSLTVIDPEFNSQFVSEYILLRKKKLALSKEAALKELNDPLTFAAMLLKNGFCDGLIAGSVYPTSSVIRAGLNIVGIKKGFNIISSFFLMTFPSSHIHKNRVLAFADCGVVPEPDSIELAEIAIQTSDSFKKLTGINPRTAFLSFSTKGSSSYTGIEKVNSAYNIASKKRKDIIFEGELQFDAAFHKAVGARKNPDGKIQGDANVFIFPDLNSGNIGYKIAERIGGAIATGPILQGFNKPVMDLSRGCTASDIVNMAKVICNI
ncbi:phosphate acetyltransferase [soil metagenome]